MQPDSDRGIRMTDQTQLIRLTAEEQRRFVELLLDPPAPAPSVERAKQAHGLLIRSRQASY